MQFETFYSLNHKQCCGIVGTLTSSRVSANSLKSGKRLVMVMV